MDHSLRRKCDKLQALGVQVQSPDDAD